MDRVKLDAYYTPLHIARDMANKLAPKQGSLVLDPMCGDGRLLAMLHSVWPERHLRYIGYDIDESALDKARELYGHLGIIFSTKDIMDWKGGDADCVIMNPSFHNDELFHSMGVAMLTFRRGIAYVPFNKEPLFNFQPTDFAEFKLKEYFDLQRHFDCEIKYRQGWVYWSKT
jgi:SAM-dependent methyltransferase